MAKKARLAREAMQIYRNRDYVLSELDDTVFDLMNTDGGGSFLACSGCLDALDDIPAGSMKAMMGGSAFYDASYVTRGISAAEQAEIDAFMNSLVDDILANNT